ncbi:MAG: hypothetical protein QF357_04465, partial [Dehalococcoidia bacterium]|nr:hypothetical protein [Dehalococcoidia bacterium]
MNDPNLNGPVRGRPVSGSPVRGRQAGNAAAGGARKAQLEMIRGNDPVPAVKKPVAGYMLRQAKLDDMHSYSQTF